MKSTRHPLNTFRRQTWSVAALACACVLTSTVALGSGSEHDHDRARRAVQSGEILPLQTLLERVQGEHPGQVLELELERDGGRWIYEIRLLQPDGRLVKLVVDARTAQVLSQRVREGRR
jgi:uncharacterized membrane protein YkoI